MSPFQGQRCRTRAAQQFVNLLNSLLRRPRPTLNCGAAPQPRCNNSINSNLPAPAPLSEPYCGQCGASAPEGGTYSRVGACPYLLDPIYESRPCKGLISRILLRGKPRPRYAPLTGAAARIDELRREIGASPYPKYEPLSGAAVPQTTLQCWCRKVCRKRLPESPPLFSTIKRYDKQL